MEWGGEMGTHKGCPYGGLGVTRWVGKRAPTRGAPTGMRGGVALGGGTGRHEACPYGGHEGRLLGTRWGENDGCRQLAGDAAPTWDGV